MPESSTDASMDAPPDVTAKDAKPRKDVAPEVGPDVTPDSPSDGGGKS